MEVSNRSKRRLLGFIASRGGRVTSGRNDSLLRWVFMSVAREAYAHERIAPLEELFEALEADGDVVLEHDERGKLFAVRLSDEADMSHADVPDEEPDEQDQNLWPLVTLLMSENSALHRRLEESDIEAALELAEAAENRRQQLEAQLAEKERALAALPDQQLLEGRLADATSELAAVSTELAATRSRYETLADLLNSKTESWAREKRDLRNRLSAAGNESARLREELEAAARAVALSTSIVTRLRAELESHEIAGKPGVPRTLICAGVIYF